MRHKKQNIYMHKIHFSRNWKLFKKKILYSRYEVLPAVSTKIDAVSDVTAWSQVEIDRLSKKRTVYVFGKKTVSHFRRSKSSKKSFFSSGRCNKTEKVHDSSQVCKHRQFFSVYTVVP